jgi:hypothetical protein
VAYFVVLALTIIAFWLMPKAEASLRYNVGATILGIAALILGWSLGRDSKK